VEARIDVGEKKIKNILFYRVKIVLIRRCNAPTVTPGWCEVTSYSSGTFTFLLVSDTMVQLSSSFVSLFHEFRTLLSSRDHLSSLACYSGGSAPNPHVLFRPPTVRYPLVGV
jgi:hypothetical protein